MALCRTAQPLLDFYLVAHRRVVQVPAPIQVRLSWRAGVAVPQETRERVAREVACLAWELNQGEALLQDAMRVAGHDRAYLMPRLELRLPLYDAQRRFRIIFSHIDEPRIHLVDEDGKRLADVVLC